MGLLDDLLGGVTGMGGQQRRPHPTSVGGNANMSRILMALLPVVLSMLAQRRQGGARQPSDLGAGAGGGLGGGGLGDILGGILGGGGGGGGPLGSLGGALGGGGATGGGPGGILGGLLERFGKAGFGQQAQSWVNVGPNDPIPTRAVEDVFGPGALGEIARRAGLGEEETAQGLAHLLPEVVDQITPDGALPDDDSLLQSVERLIARSGGGDAQRS